MPSDDKSKYDDDDIISRDEDDLFKKYSLKEGENYSNKKDYTGKHSSEKDFQESSRIKKIFQEIIMTTMITARIKRTVVLALVKMMIVSSE
jgi:hypothetical protein